MSYLFFAPKNNRHVIKEKEHNSLELIKKTFHYTVSFFEICFTYDGLVSKALPLRTSSPERFFLYMPLKKNGNTQL